MPVRKMRGTTDGEPVDGNTHVLEQFHVVFVEMVKSSATSPVSPWNVFPGVWEKVCHTDGLRPSSFAAPSI